MSIGSRLAPLAHKEAPAADFGGPTPKPCEGDYPTLHNRNRRHEDNTIITITAHFFKRVIMVREVLG